MRLIAFFAFLSLCIKLFAAVTLTSALERVSAHYDVAISYSPSQTDAVGVENMPLFSSTVGNALSQLLAGTDYGYGKVSDRVYYLFKDKQKIALRKQREAREKEQAAIDRICEYRRHEMECRLACKHGKMLVPKIEKPLQGTVNADIEQEWPADRRNDEPAMPVVLKTNALLLASASANVTLELPVGAHVSAELSVSINRWPLGDARLLHVAVSPALKYWLGSEPMQGDYVGAYAEYANYDIGGIGFAGANLADNYYKGNLYSAGILYGHRFILCRHFALEAEIGMGYVYTKYDCNLVDPAVSSVASRAVKDGSKHKFGISRLALNVCYMF